MEAISLSSGKVEKEAVGEVNKTIAHCDFYIKNADTFMKAHEFHDSHYTYFKTQLRPLGLVYKIAPFNFPLWIGMKPAIAGLLLGNSTLIRNTERALLLSEIQEEIFKHPDLKEKLAISYNDRSELEAIIGMHQIKGVSFTGSVPVGKMVGEICGRYLKRVQLELGGSDAFVITKNVDVKEAVDALFEARKAN